MTVPASLWLPGAAGTWLLAPVVGTEAETVQVMVVDPALKVA